MNLYQKITLAFILASFSLLVLMVGCLVGIQQLPNVSQAPVFILGGLNFLSLAYLFRSVK